MEKKQTAADAAKEERSTGKPTSAQDTGPKGQVNEELRGDDYGEEETHLDSNDLREADAGHKGLSGGADD